MTLRADAAERTSHTAQATSGSQQTAALPPAPVGRVTSRIAASPSARGVVEACRKRRLHRPRLTIELIVLGICYAAYELTRIAVRSNHTIALANARSLYGLEQKLHIDPEMWMNTVVNIHPLVAKASGYYYATAHFAITLVVIGWLYARHPVDYRRMRTILIVSSLSALLMFWRFPVTPPRFAVHHMTDTLDVWNILAVVAPHPGSTVANLDAAMPSLHVGWAVWCALAVWQVYRYTHPRLAMLAWIYPVITTVVVLGTANHYLLDVLVGVALITVGNAATKPLRAFGEQWPEVTTEAAE